ncbi:MAG: exopolysaccharide transport family protein [Hyphomicrobiaceae bacterium]|nr:exopolysaccharide transport family protein [Hyphomicrobiaceae bacterium]
MAAKTTASPDDIDMTSLSALLLRAAPRLLVVAMLAAGLTYLVLSMMAPYYAAQSELAIVARGGDNPFRSPQSGGDFDQVAARMDKEAINTHVRALMSPEIAEAMIAQKGLAQRREFNAALGPVDTLDGLMRRFGIGAPKASEPEADRVLNAYFRRLEVYSPKESRAITIRFTATDPELAAEIANEIAEAYRERLAKAAIVETDDVQKALAPKIEKLSAEVAEAEAQVASYRASAGLLRGGAQRTPVNEQQLGDLTAELTKVGAARVAADARARTARDLMRRGTPEIIPEVQRSPLVQGLIQQKVQVERELIKLSASMKPAHPVIRQLNADLQTVRKQINVEVANLVASLDKEAIVAAEQEEAIQASLGKLKTTVAGNTADEVELRQLEAVATSRRTELERLQAQFEANRARADAGVVPVEAQILTRARPSSVAVFPRKLPYTLLVFAASLLFGTALVITAGLARGARSGGTSNAEAARLRQEIAHVAAAAGRLSAHAGEQGYGAAAASDAAPALAHTAPRPYAHLNDGAALAKRLAKAAKARTSGYRTLVVGRGEAHGLARLVMDVARRLEGAGGQAIVVDWAPDGRGIAAEIGVGRSPGLTELLAGKASFADVVAWVEGSGVHIIAAGTPAAGVGRDSDAERLNLILDALDETYEHIILVAAAGAGRQVFGLIEGRIDAGVHCLAAGARGTDAALDADGTFLGFAVADIDLVTVTAPAGAEARAGRRARPRLVAVETAR